MREQAGDGSGILPDVIIETHPYSFRCQVSCQADEVQPTARNKFSCQHMKAGIHISLLLVPYSLLIADWHLEADKHVAMVQCLIIGGWHTAHQWSFMHWIGTQSAQS